MAITVNALTRSGVWWGLNATSADLSGCEELKAAPSGGQSLYIEHVFISTVSAITVTIGAGETAGAVTATLLGPFSFAATAGGPVDLYFRDPIKITAKTALVADASGAGAVTIVVEGFTR